jgi:hypothetical protein
MEWLESHSAAKNGRPTKAKNEESLEGGRVSSLEAGR